MENQTTTFQLDIAFDRGTAWQALANLWADFDCDTDKECVPADSSNASRACMPFAG